MSKKNDLTVDQSDLGAEWRKQPNLYHAAAVQLADAKLELDEAEDALELSYAELDNLIRENPATYNARATEPSIKQAIIRNTAYQARLQRVREAKYAVNVVQAYARSLEHKREALGSSVYLHNQDYFSEPRIPKGGGEFASEQRRRDLRGGDSCSRSSHE